MAVTDIRSGRVSDVTNQISGGGGSSGAGSNPNVGGGFSGGGGGGGGGGSSGATQINPSNAGQYVRTAGGGGSSGAGSDSKSEAKKNEVKVSSTKTIEKKDATREEIKKVQASGGGYWQSDKFGTVYVSGNSKQSGNYIENEQGVRVPVSEGVAKLVKSKEKPKQEDDIAKATRLGQSMAVSDMASGVKESPVAVTYDEYMAGKLDSYPSVMVPSEAIGKGKELSRTQTTEGTLIEYSPSVLIGTPVQNMDTSEIFKLSHPELSDADLDRIGSNIESPLGKFVFAANYAFSLKGASDLISVAFSPDRERMTAQLKAQNTLWMAETTYKSMKGDKAGAIIDFIFEPEITLGTLGLSVAIPILPEAVQWTFRSGILGLSAYTITDRIGPFVTESVPMQLEGKPSQFGTDVIALASSGFAIKGIMKEVGKMNTIDTVIKGIDVKEFNQVAFEKTTYVPRYGLEIGSSLTMEKVGLGRNQFRNVARENIYGVPSQKNIPIKDFDLGLEVKVAAERGGIMKTESLSFKVTDSGIEPLGELSIKRFTPDLKNKLFYLLDQTGPSNLNFEKGFVDNIKVGGGRPQVSIMESALGDGWTREIVGMKILGIEKPPTFSVDIMKGKVGPLKQNLIKMTGDSELNPSRVMDMLDIRDLRKLTPVLNIEGGGKVSITTMESVISEKASPIGVDIIRESLTGPRTPETLMPKRTKPSVNSALSDRFRMDSVMTIKVVDELAPTDLNITYGRTMGGIDRQFPLDFVTGIQGQKIRDFTVQDTAFLQSNMSVTAASPDTVSVREMLKGKADNDWKDFDRPAKLLIVNSKGMMKSFNIEKLSLPTASAYSLERAFSKYGSASLARGPKVEKIFRNLMGRQGISLEFPAAEEITGRRRRR